MSHLCHDLQGNPNGDFRALTFEILDQVAKVYRLEVLHHHRRAAIQARQVIDVHDVAVAQKTEEARLVANTTTYLFAVRPLCVQELDGNDAREPIRVLFFGQVDRPKTTRGDGTDEAELATSIRHHRHPLSEQGSTRTLA